MHAASVIRFLLRIHLLFLLSLSIAPSVARAQDAGSELIHGRVTDPQGHPIAGAHVRVSGATTGTTAGQDGRFRIRLPGGDASLLHASAAGYQPHREAPASDSRADGFVIILERAPYTLSGISVTGTTRSEIARVPGATSIVGANVLHDRAPLSVMDALRTVPGVQTADEDPFGLNLNVGFRGLPPRRSSRTLLLEDGVPILLGPYGDPSMHYAPPVEALERLEIIKGSGQIMNGPQTVGGVINFVTRRPPAEGTQGSATLGGGTLGYRNAHLSLATGRSGRAVSLDYTFREGEGVRREQGHRIHNAIVTGLLPLGDRQTLTVKGALWDEASRISETGLTQAEFEADPFSLPFSAAGRFDVRRYLGQVVHEANLGRARFQTNAYFSNLERASWRQSGESEERLGEDDYADDFNCAPGAASYDECGNQGRPREYTVAGVEPRLTLDLAGPAEGSTVDLGARLYREDVRRRQFLGDTPFSREDDALLTRENEIATNVIAAFAHARLRMGRATFLPGLRVEHLSQDIRNRFPGMEAEIEQSYTQLLPGVGTSYLPTEGVTLFAGVHRGFAPPRPADVYRPEPGQAVVLVDPETSWNWEIGGRLEPRPGLHAEATFFRMDFGNQIIEGPAGGGQRFFNGGRTLHQGVELGGLVSLGTLRRTVDDLTLNATYTFLPTARFESGDARGDDVAGNRLPYAARHLASGSATLAHRSGITLSASMEHTGEQFADDENTLLPSDDGQDGLLPSYTVVHASGSYSLPGTRLQLRASIRNVFNDVYITQRNEGIYTGMRRLLRTEIHWSF